MTYFIGAMCLWNIPLAAGLAVLLTIILMAKHSMHDFAGKWIKGRIQGWTVTTCTYTDRFAAYPDHPLWGEVLNPMLS